MNQLLLRQLYKESCLEKVNDGTRAGQNAPGESKPKNHAQSHN